MKKLTFIERLKVETGLAKTEVAAVTDLFFSKMSDTLANGERVERQGLCSFHVKDYPGYTDRKPKASKKIKIKPEEAIFP